MFVCFDSLSPLANTSRLVPHLRLAISLMHIAFFIWNRFFLISNLLRGYNEGMLNVIKCFYFISWEDGVFFLLMWFITLIDLQMLKHSLHLGNKSHLIITYDILWCSIEFHLLIFCWEFLHLCLCLWDMKVSNFLVSFF